MDATDGMLLMRGVERLLIVGGAGMFAVLGYKLFMNGVREGYAKLSADVKVARFVFSGVGPGLFFMAFGAIVLVVIATTRVERTTRTTIQPLDTGVQVAHSDETPVVEVHEVMVGSSGPSAEPEKEDGQP